MDENKIPENILTSGNIILIACRMLYNINESILRHNEHTAYLALQLVKNYQLNPRCSEKNLILLSLFHTLGFFSSYVNHENQFNSKQDYFSTDKATKSKYVFTCYYLEHFTPLKKDAHALATFTQDFDEFEKQAVYQTEYKSIIYLCSKIADYIETNKGQSLPEDLNELAPGKLDPTFVRLFTVKNQNDSIVKGIHNGTFWNKLSDYISELEFTKEEQIDFLKLLVYILDFKSTQTLVHSINTGSYALSIGRMLNLTDKELEELFLSAILHDVGKTRSPKWILEAHRGLSIEERKMMEPHVTHSRNILKDLVPNSVVEAVYNHHELCNGSGYPNKLKGENIPKLSKIITIADIASSLMDMRSYKASFDKDRTLQIMEQMAVIEQRFDFEYVAMFLNKYDVIKSELPTVQNFFTVNFADVINKYNDYLFNNPEFMEDVSDQELLELEEAVE